MSQREINITVFDNVVWKSWERQGNVAYRFRADSGYQLEIMTYGFWLSCAMSHLTRLEALLNMILEFLMILIALGNSPKHGASAGPVRACIAGATFELNSPDL